MAVSRQHRSSMVTCEEEDGSTNREYTVQGLKIAMDMMGGGEGQFYTDYADAPVDFSGGGV